jgi:pimeloyl-ACP methyl ester carboxylesterase
MKTLQDIVRVGLLGAIVLTQTGAAPQKEPYVASSYLHAQRLVDVGGRRLNIICAGTGSPTVIRDAGLAADATSWRLVQPAIARHTRVCSYDRAGMGFSDATTSSRDAAAIVNDLHALLIGARISPPYVLVGWSVAGLYTRLHVDRYPDDVAGLVQVDPSSENDEDDAEKIVPNRDSLIKHRDKQFRDCAVNVSLGTCAFFPGGLTQYRKALRAAGCPHVDPQDCAVVEVVGEHQAQGAYWKDVALESEAITRSSSEVRVINARTASYRSSF